MRNPRRTSSPAQRFPINRWAHWASSLIDRHNRVTSRLDALNFVLSRPASVIHSSQKWFVSSLRLQPRINLAIQPILHNTVIDRRQTKYFSNATAANMAAQPDWRRLDEVTQIERLVVRERSEAPADESASTVAIVSRDVSREMYLSLHTPLARIFHQLLKAEDRILKTSGQKAEQVAGDVSGKLQRIEEKSFADSETVTRRMTTTVEREVKLAMERAGSRQPQGLSNLASQWEMREPPAAPHTGAWPQDAARAAQIDIERIADQVMRQFDRRIVAQRERMGKI